MRFWIAAVIGAGAFAAACVARADDSTGGPAAALLSAGAIEVTGFVVGGILVAQGRGDHLRDNAGWLTVESSFVLAPLAAHGAEREWGRGALFAIVPACALGITATLFELQPGTVESGTLPQQRWMWTMFGAGLFSSAVGVVDALWAPARAPGRGRNLFLMPSVGWGRVGLEIGGTL
jgi:hypothetical protein